MADPWVDATQSVPLNGSSVNQRTKANAAGVVTPATHNTALSGGSSYGAISTAMNTIVSNKPGRLCRLIVLGTGGTLGAITCYDNASAASGTVIFGPTSPSAGQIIDLQIPVQNGIVVTTAAATTLLVTYEQA